MTNTSLHHSPSLSETDLAASPTLFDGFVASRTTLDDLQQRIQCLGQRLRICDLASHLTGKTRFPDHVHNAVARALNDRLAELGEQPQVSYRSEPAPNPQWSSAAAS